MAGEDKVIRTPILKAIIKIKYTQGCFYPILKVCEILIYVCVVMLTSVCQLIDNHSPFYALTYENIDRSLLIDCALFEGRTSYLQILRCYYNLYRIIVVVIVQTKL